MLLLLGYFEGLFERAIAWRAADSLRTRPRLLLISAATCASAALLQAQAPPAEQVAQERAQAKIEIPRLVEVLALKRSMTVADVGAGFGAMTVVLAKRLVTVTGLDPGAAREKVRVARALARLPQISAAMERGELSYSKVRAMTRVAVPENETRLLGAAQGGTAAHVAKLVRAWRRADRLDEARETSRRHQQRYLQTWVDEDGMLVMRGRLTPELGAVVQRALEAAGDRLFRESTTDPRNDATAEVTPGQRRADALGLLAESALASDVDRGTPGDRYQVVIHVDEDTLKADAGPAAEEAVTRDAGQAVLEDVDGMRVSAETSRRMACDASTVVMRHAADGTVLDVGRKRRTIPPAIRRALAARDRHCQFPGCTGRHCDVHHIQHWADGGATRLTNLALLCRGHHRAVHEEGYTLTRGPDGTVAVCRPDGRHCPPRPLRPAGDTVAAMSGIRSRPALRGWRPPTFGSAQTQPRQTGTANASTYTTRLACCEITRQPSLPGKAFPLNI